jgi:pentachlorophenol monooxygenase/3-(3-hydroxy-phenyl)propionate hydroxylase
VDSPLTTPDPSRPFAGRPERGTTAPAGPGILVPDAPIALADSSCRRLREIARDGFLLLATPGAEGAATEAAADTRGPVRALSLAEIDISGALRDALAARPNEVWVIRPDAHVAAVLTSPRGGDVASALRRAQGERSSP